ncbi:SapC family protein [Mesorhizobium xinjiangense]|uniref:SapC family protein n=1 Tax=Mesorhizobium xinjiangense TaxID=2678685 RepID=UPI0018DB0923|nr:SapC family protein [Mesorhizobium xinjiangense]
MTATEDSGNWRTLPSFYKRPVVLCADAHRHSGLSPSLDFAFASKSTAIPLGVGEFQEALQHYPIVFAPADLPVPLAVTGLVKGGNLFVSPDGSWRSGAYVPDYLQRYPFILGTGVNAETAPLVVDESCARFVDARADRSAVRLFHDDGSPTELTGQAVSNCLSAHHEQARTMEFANALREARILTAGRARITSPDGTSQTLEGFSNVDERAYRTLPDSVLSRWFEAGWLDALALQRASHHNWERLADLYLERAAERSGA